jgi:hypothetical protein
MKTFINQVLDGEATVDDIDFVIEQWHQDGNYDANLASYLGMTITEYTAFLTDNDVLARVVKTRQIKGVKLKWACVDKESAARLSSALNKYMKSTFKDVFYVAELIAMSYGVYTVRIEVARKEDEALINAFAYGVIKEMMGDQVG